MHDEKFAVFVISHKRSKTMKTPSTLRRCGYTGPMYVVVSDDEPELDEYRKGEHAVLTYSREKYRSMCDIGDSRPDLTMCSQVRNAIFDLAKDLSFDYFAVFDDDYSAVSWKHLNANGSCVIQKSLHKLDAVFEAFCSALKSMPSVTCLSFAQGGDYIGSNVRRGTFRKMMNAMIFCTKRRVVFVGRYNDDITAYVLGQFTGSILCLTIPTIVINQPQMSIEPGGMSEAYKQDGGGYIKAMYAVMRVPSAIRVAPLLSKYPRIHTSVLSKYAYPRVVEVPV